MPQVSLVATIKNEARSIEALLDSLAAQERPPDEVVLVDGGSTDDTVPRILAHPLSRAGKVRLLVRPQANISQGRNCAIRQAQGELIVCTDAGVRLERHWLAELLRPFQEQNPPPELVAGFFLPDVDSVFERAMGATVLPALEDITPARFNPSSRSVAFRRAAWERVGGYPEWLDYGEDLWFDLRLRAAGCRIAFAPDAVVHFRPRGTLGAFFRQYYRYARGDGKANLWPRRHALRYLTYLIALPLLLGLGAWHTPLWWLLLPLGAAAMFYTPYKRLRRWLAPLRPLERLQAILWVPVIRVTGDLAKMLGYPVGVWWRWRHGKHQE